MTDREFLIWLHERLDKVHGESPLWGYMHRLRAIIYNTPPDQKSLGYSDNGIEGLIARMDAEQALDER